MKIEITDEEREILNEVLQGAFTTLEIEMHRTDDLRFKENLKHRCDTLEGLLKKLVLTAAPDAPR